MTFPRWASAVSWAILAMVLAAGASAQTPTVATDRYNYSPGEIVTFTGSGWLPGETVTILLTGDPLILPARTLHAVADEAGAIFNTEFSPAADDYGVTFAVEATGGTSGWTAQTVFADGGFAKNPTAQSAPYCQSFDDLPWSAGCLDNARCPSGEPWPAGWEGWRVGFFPSFPSQQFLLNDPLLDENLRANGTAVPNAGGVYNYGGKLGLLGSNTSNPALTLAVSTLGVYNVAVTFDVMTIRNPWSGDCTNALLRGNRTNQLDLQYRLGTSGAWSSASGNPSGVYQSPPGPLAVLATDPPQNLQTVTVMLPPVCSNHPHVQLRWVQRDLPGQCGPRPSFAIDNVSVGNAPPVVTIDAPASGTVTAVNTVVPFAGSFSGAPGELHTAQWYLDGVPVGAPITAAGNSAGSGTVSLDHVFTAAGVYAVKLVVTDQCGLSTMATTVGGLDAMVVVYDPSAGFATGGGWIESPAGAYAPDPSLAGMANFGFVSKYKKGMTVPTGETEFQFRTAGLNFHSASYEWMVISGAKVQCKGRGTVDGAGDYDFMLSAIDGDLKNDGTADRFRMKIADHVTGDLVYDNQMGALDGAEPSTALGGGTIMIHSGGGSALVAAGAERPGASGTLPLAFGLGQNHPNPFAGSTSIGFDLPRPGRVTLSLYDVSGRLVRTLADEERAAGRHVIAWTGESDDGSRAPAGVYFYRIVVEPAAGGSPFTSLKRMVLLK